MQTAIGKASGGLQLGYNWKKFSKWEQEEKEEKEDKGERSKRAKGDKDDKGNAKRNGDVADDSKKPKEKLEGIAKKVEPPMKMRRRPSYVGSTGDIPKKLGNSKRQKVAYRQEIREKISEFLEEVLLPSESQEEVFTALPSLIAFSGIVELLGSNELNFYFLEQNTWIEVDRSQLVSHRFCMLFFQLC